MDINYTLKKSTNSDINFIELESRKDEFARRGNFLYQELQRLGFDIAVKPEGAFYIYADCSQFTDDRLPDRMIDLVCRILRISSAVTDHSPRDRRLRPAGRRQNQDQG